LLLEILTIPMFIILRLNDCTLIHANVHKFISILIFLALSSTVSAQQFEVKLSPKHVEKLNNCRTGTERLKKYYKFFKKDSTKADRKLQKQYLKTIDSAYRAESKNERHFRRLARKGISLPDVAQNGSDSINGQIRRWLSIVKDSTQSDSAKAIAEEKVKQLVTLKAKQYPGFQNALEKYQLSQDTASWKSLTNQIPGLDTLGGMFNSNSSELFGIAESQAFNQLEGLTGWNSFVGSDVGLVKDLMTIPRQYQSRFQNYTNIDSLQSEAKKKAVDEALDYFSKHSDKLQGAQAKMSKLLAKYSEFTNANDLSDAVKHTSLKGKSVLERLAFSANFNVVSSQPVSIDLSPQIGYRFNSKFIAGAGMNYRATFSDSIRSSKYISPKNSAFKVFSNYTFYKSFFVSAEWEKSGIPFKRNDHKITEWKDNYFIGVGKRFLIHPKLYLIMTAQYNLNSDDKNPIHPRRFQIRTGFQLSELATRKKQVHYHPNY
jgi:hypothetical protein